MSLVDNGIQIANLLKDWGAFLQKQDQKWDERLRTLVKLPGWYRAVPFRQAANTGRYYDLPNPVQVRALKVTAVPRGGGGGNVYINFDDEVRLGADGLPVVDWDWVGSVSVSTPAIPLNLPINRIYIYTPADLDGTIYVGSGKDALPG